jgi:hypothetical protein
MQNYAVISSISPKRLPPESFKHRHRLIHEVSMSSLPAPKVGDIIRYNYLWAHDVTKGEAAKQARPCLILQVNEVNAGLEVLLLPICDEPPVGRRFVGIIPQSRMRSGRADYGANIVVGECNVTAWPSWDIVQVTAQDTGEVLPHATLDDTMMTAARNGYDSVRAANELAVVNRRLMRERAVNDWKKRRDDRAWQR